MSINRLLNRRLASVAVASIFLTVTVFSALLGGTIAFASNPPPEVEWEQYYGGTNQESAWAGDQTSDGGYMIVGTTQSYGAGNTDFYLVKTDADGNMEWQNTYGGIGYDSAFGGQQTADGGYIIAGTTTSYGAGSHDCYLVKTDASGNMEWQQTYGDSDNDGAYWVQQTSDGGYIIAGDTASYDIGEYDVLLIKTDNLGNVEWQQNYGDSDWDYAESVYQTSDGGYITAGETCINDEDGDAYLVKTDASGNITWQTIFGGSGYDAAYSVCQASDGGYIAAGYTVPEAGGAGDILLFKTDSSGNVIWDEAIGGSVDEYTYSVRQTSDGGFIIAGATCSYGAGQYDMYIVKTDASGNTEWEKTVGGASSEGTAYGVQTADGGYIIFGDTHSYGAGSNDFYLVKLSSGINTPAGSDVTVDLYNGTVNFPTVNQSGVTTITTSTENPADPTPSDFYVIEGNFTEITTTADYSGLITVGLNYDEEQVDNEESLRLFHWIGSEWEDVTTSVDTVANIIYGEVSSLSPFFIGEPIALPVAEAGGPYLVRIDNSLVLDGSDSYHPDGTIVDYDWDFGDSNTGNGITAPHTYNVVGIYEATLTVTDSRGSEATDTSVVVVYDPDSGSATGGGWFWSDKGNLIADPESEGKATFGFVVKYRHEIADGNLEFHYRIGDMKLKDTEVTWLITGSTMAQFQGQGTINGEGLYTYSVQAKDGDKMGGVPDEFTIFIWEGTDTEADPIYKANNVELGGGNIMIHDN